MNWNLPQNRFAEDGVRPYGALDGLAVRFWRLGALVFRPDFARMSHEVGPSAEWQRIVVWAIRATGSARCRKNVCGNRSRGESREGRTMDLSHWKGYRQGLANRAAGAARPAVYPAPGSAPVASPQSRILRWSGNNLLPKPGCGKDPENESADQERKMNT